MGSNTYSQSLSKKVRLKCNFCVTKIDFTFKVGIVLCDMSVLQSLSRRMLESLFPQTLHEFGEYLTAKGGVFHLAKVAELADIGQDVEIIETALNPALAKTYHDYREAFVEQLQILDEDDSDNEVNDKILVLLDNLRKCGNEQIINRLEEYPNSNLGYQKGLPEFEYIIRFLLSTKDEDYLAQTIRNSARVLSRGFHYYKKNLEELGFEKEAFTPGDLFDKALKEQLRDEIKTTYGYKFCVVHSEELKDGRWFIEIRHAGKKRKELAIKNEDAQDTILSPLETDIVMYHPVCKEIRIHMQNRLAKFERDTYVKGIGSLLSGKSCKWPIFRKFNLERFLTTREELQGMLKKGASRFSSSSIGYVDMLLTDIIYTVSLSTLDGGKPTCHKCSCHNSETGLLSTMAKESILLEDEKLMWQNRMNPTRNKSFDNAVSLQIEQISFAIVPKVKGIAGRFSVTVKPETLSDPNRSDVEEWLEDIGIA